MSTSNKYCFFGIPSSEGALGKNKGCENAPSALAKLFSVEMKEFSLTKNDIELQEKRKNQFKNLKTKVKVFRLNFGARDSSYFTKTTRILRFPSP